MKYRFQITSATLLLILFASCSSINVVRVSTSSEVEKSEGIYYVLPKTIIDISVAVERKDEVAGPYAAYASKHLGLSDVITESTTSYKMKSVSFDSYEIADPEQYFYIDCSNLKKRTLQLQFEESGFITAYNTKARFDGKQRKLDTSFSFDENVISTMDAVFFTSSLAEKFDTVIEKIAIDTNIIVKKSVKKSYINKTEEQKAQEAADLIMKLEESRLSLLTGYSEVSYSKETMQYMADQLLQLEQEYLHLFTGITVLHQKRYNFQYIPCETGNSGRVPLFRFSEKSGIADTSDFKGDTVYLSVEPSASTDSLIAFETARMDPKERNHGLYYRVPEMADFVLSFMDLSIAESSLSVFQFGTVLELPAKGISSISFNRKTGGIEKIKFGNRKHPALFQK